MLDSVRKREVLSFKSEKVTFQKAQSLSQKTTKQTTTNKHENRYSINLLRWSYFLNHWQTPELAGKQKPELLAAKDEPVEFSAVVCCEAVTQLAFGPHGMLKTDWNLGQEFYTLNLTEYFLQTVIYWILYNDKQG